MACSHRFFYCARLAIASFFVRATPHWFILSRSKMSQDASEPGSETGGPGAEPSIAALAIDFQQLTDSVMGMNHEFNGFKDSHTALQAELRQHSGLLNQMVSGLQQLTVHQAASAAASAAALQQAASVSAAQQANSAGLQQTGLSAAPPRAMEVPSGPWSAPVPSVAAMGPGLGPRPPFIAPPVSSVGPDYANFNNGNVERNMPGVTAAAQDILSGGAIPVGGLASSSTLPGMGMSNFPSMQEARVLKRGMYGTHRSTMVMLVESFTADLGGQSVIINEFVDPNSGEYLKRVVVPKQLSDVQLLQLFPNLASWEEAHTQMGNAMVRRKVILVHEFKQYLIFMSAEDEAFTALCLLGEKGWLAALQMDRELRVAQWKHGYPWDQAFRMGFFVKAYVKVMLQLQSPPTVGPAAPAPAPAPRNRSGWQPSADQKPFCYQFARQGTCSKGESCSYSQSHHCLRCEALGHGFQRCPQGGNA